METCFHTCPRAHPAGSRKPISGSYSCTKTPCANAGRRFTVLRAHLSHEHVQDADDRLPLALLAVGVHEHLVRRQVRLEAVGAHLLVKLQRRAAAVRAHRDRQRRRVDLHRTRHAPRAHLGQQVLHRSHPPSAARRLHCHRRCYGRTGNTSEQLHTAIVRLHPQALLRTSARGTENIHPSPRNAAGGDLESPTFH